MTSLDRQIVSAIVILTRRNGGEVHGFWPEIIEKIDDELSQFTDGEAMELFTSYVRNMGLKYVLEESPVAFFRSTTGEINLVYRELLNV